MEKELTDKQIVDQLAVELYQKFHAGLKRWKVGDTGKLERYILSKDYKILSASDKDLIKGILISTLEYGKFSELGVGRGMKGGKGNDYWSSREKGHRNFKRKTGRAFDQSKDKASGKMHRRMRKYWYAENVTWFEKRLGERLIEKYGKKSEEILDILSGISKNYS